jgi:2',3'-cyclic-nucleotide 2'-phosphodiesterase (5'-nucleotidase family)
MNLKAVSAAIMLAVILPGCMLLFPAKDTPAPEFAYPGPDPEIQSSLEEYRGKYMSRVGQKIATVHDTLRFEKPEGALNNYVADALRFRAAAETGTFVNVGVIGESSFKVYFTPGELIVEDVLEFMPYDNHLVILTMKGFDLERLVHQIAEAGGAPISGVRFSIGNDGRARGILVNSEVINPNRNYLVATSSWAANGGDQFPALWSAVNRVDLSLQLKDLFIDYFKSESDLYNITDGRIR